ncbi:hypothetical protein [Desulfovibrio sp. MES5]|uniref:hypothetical protein n=1 Tax=Desulfovibrio sp. MES5 TaxID=1899016 RepID=UPI0025BABB7C|nr:hypothetical protein [Desulfovibrio sp. MES5]
MPSNDFRHRAQGQSGTGANWQKMQDASSFQFFVEQFLAVFIHAMHLKNILCDIQSDLTDYSHDPPPWFLVNCNGHLWHFDAVESMTLRGVGLSHQKRSPG